MLSWKALSLVVAAAVAMNGVVSLEQGYGGGVSTTATPTSIESSTDQESGSGEYTQSTSDSAGSDAYPGETPTPDSSYGNSLSWDGSGINVGGSYPGGKFTSGDGSYVDVPSATGDGSVELPPPSDVSSNSNDAPPSSATGSDRDGSTNEDDSIDGEASTSGDGETPPNGGCQVRTRRLRQ